MNPSALSQLARRTPEPPISWLMKMTLDHPKLISLAAGFTDNQSLPVREARVLLRGLLSSARSGQSALQYGSTQGDPRLRQLTAKHLLTSDGVSQEYQPISNRTLITHGSQQLLYIATECLCDPGDIVLVEDPTYFVYLGITQSHGLRCRGIRLEADGLSIAHLDRTLSQLKRSGGLRRVKLLYLVSYFQNPSGVTTRFEKKAAALDVLSSYERAAGHPIYLLEDAAYRELRFAGDDEPSALAAKRGADRVIYAGTYSKPFATGVRVGFGVLPEPVFSAALRVKGNHDFGTANLLQQLLATAMASGQYARHVGRLRRRYAGKAAVMVEAIRRHFPSGVQWQEPRGGLYVWATLPDRLRSGPKSRLFQSALARDVLYVPGRLCYADDPSRAIPDSAMRLSFGGATETNIRTGIKRLGAVLQEMSGIPNLGPRKLRARRDSSRRRAVVANV